MPISEKIKMEISNLSSTSDEKKLLLDLLEIEDMGGYRYQAAYQQVIKDYLSAHKEEKMTNEQNSH